MKTLVRNLLRVSGAFTPFRLANRNKALILMYHRFSENEDGAATSKRAFEQHLNYLTAHYCVVPLSQIADLIARGERLPPKLAAITIDDGYQDAYEIAFPLLRRYKTPATLFVVTDFIERKTWLWTDKLKFLTPRTTARWLEFSVNNCLSRIELSDARSRSLAAAHVNSLLKAETNQAKDRMILEIADSLGVALPYAPPDEFRPLSWDEIRELDKAGVEIGSHTVTHPILTRIKEEQLRYELRESKAQLESRLGRLVDLFCFPNGNYDKQVVCETERAGYRCSVTTDYGLNDSSTSLLRLRRVPAESDLSRFVQSTSGFEEAKLRVKTRWKMKWKRERPFPSDRTSVKGAQIQEG
jgi:peptidoglycan/xylan/chitin deacetylase (PgdA/CDA1 family)